jgi:hypothetical protein
VADFQPKAVADLNNQLVDGVVVSSQTLSGGVLAEMWRVGTLAKPMVEAMSRYHWYLSLGQESLQLIAILEYDYSRNDRVVYLDLYTVDKISEPVLTGKSVFKVVTKLMFPFRG